MELKLARRSWVLVVDGVGGQAETGLLARSLVVPTRSRTSRGGQCHVISDIDDMHFSLSPVYQFIRFTVQLSFFDFI